MACNNSQVLPSSSHSNLSLLPWPAYLFLALFAIPVKLRALRLLSSSPHHPTAVLVITELYPAFTNPAKRIIGMEFSSSEKKKVLLLGQVNQYVDFPKYMYPISHNLDKIK